MTVNVTPLLACPFAVATTGPLVTLAGTVATMLVAVQLETVAGVPLNATVPGVPVKVVPVSVTTCPATPASGLIEEITGGGITVNVTPFDGVALTHVTTDPVDAPAGTVTPIAVSVQLVMAAGTPVNVTAPLP